MALVVGNDGLEIIKTKLNYSNKANTVIKSTVSKKKLPTNVVFLITYNPVLGMRIKDCNINPHEEVNLSAVLL